MYNYDNGYRNPMVLEEQAGQLEARSALYLAKVMGWMCVGLLTTVTGAMVCLAVPEVRYMVFGSSFGFLGILIAQILIAMVLSAAIDKLSPAVATVLFMAYSALTGLTISVIVLAYEFFSIILAFSTTTTVFLGMSLYGFVTKRDLTGWRPLLTFGLFGIIIGGVVNMFLGNAMLDFVITCVGVVVFIGLIAYDTHKIKAIYQSATVGGYSEESPEVRKLAIFGALTLYLDFINLFLRLVRLMGRRRN